MAKRCRRAQRRPARWTAPWARRCCGVFPSSGSATRLGALWPAAALAAALTALAAYALHLYRRRRSRRLDAERARAGQRRAAVYRLTMLPEKTALCQAAEALARPMP